MVATLRPPAGPLHVIITCLEFEPAYNDDRIAQAETVADLATDPDLDGSLPIIVAGDLNAALDSPILRPLSDLVCREPREEPANPRRSVDYRATRP